MFMFPSSSTGTVTGASFSTNFIPSGSGLLTSLSFQQDWLDAKGTTSNVCLVGADFSSESEVLSVSIPNCGDAQVSPIKPDSLSAGRSVRTLIFLLRIQSFTHLSFVSQCLYALWIVCQRRLRLKLKSSITKLSDRLASSS